MPPHRIMEKLLEIVWWHNMTNQQTISFPVTDINGPFPFGHVYLMRSWPEDVSLHLMSFSTHDDVIKWKYFPRYCLFVRGIHRSPVNSPYKGQWCGALMFSLICTCINGWVNNHDAGDLKRHRASYDVIVMWVFGGKYADVESAVTNLLYVPMELNTVSHL